MDHASTKREIGFGRLLRARRGDIMAAAVVLAFFALFFGWIIFGGTFIVGGDAFVETHPLRAVFWNGVARGELQLWTPHIFSGYPLLSIAQLAVGYPLTWGYLFLPSHVAEEIYVLAPFVLAPIFTYAYAREINLSRTASLLAGLSFAYGGMMTIANGVIGMPTNGLMWLPLLLVALERARRDGDSSSSGEFLRPLVYATLAFSMSVLNGHGQSFVYVGALAAAYAAFLSFGVRVGAEGRHGNGRRRRLMRLLRPLAVCLGAFALSAGVAAFQILETMRAVRRSVRSALSYETFAEGSFTLRQAALSFVSPLYNFIDVTTYVSPLVFLLALLAVATAVASTRHRGLGRDDATAVDAARVYFWFGVALISFALMLGSNTPLYRVAYHVPLLNKFRVPSRHAFEWTFALSILGACGWDSAARLFASHRAPRGRATFFLAMTLALAATLAGAYWFRSAAPTLDTQGMTKLTTLAEAHYVALKATFSALVLLLFWCAWRVAGDSRRKGLLLCVVLLVSFVEPYILVHRWWSHFVKPAGRFARVAPVTRYLQQFPPAEGRVYTRVSLYLDEFLGDAPFDAQNRTALYGLHNVAGYDPLILERYSRALGNVNFDGVTARTGSPDNPALLSDRSHVLDLLNTRHLVTFANLATVLHRPPDSIAAPDVLLASGRWSVARLEGNVVVLDNARTLPRAWLAAEAEAVDGEEALRRIQGDGAKTFDPRRTALLEVAPSELPALPGGELGAESGAAVVSYAADRISIETRADKPSVLVVSEIFYPGWEATVDGQPAPLRLTDYLLRGVYVEAGSHRVEMRYRSPALRYGALISLSTLLLLCVLGVLSVRLKRAGAAVKQS
ncbi:MAG TPA: YfhO family protein [Pyrinomonadaceae bacterium]|nr:YfhO family protein [Pyrinomonadaceae bacterium]